jgi:phosphate-selective porin OprO/OprP
MKTHHIAAIAVILAARFSASESRAQDAASPDVPALIKRIDELEQKVKILERNRELDQDASAEKAKTTPTVSLGANGLIVRSGDSNFLMDIHGYAQADARYYLGHKTVPDTFLLRRVRPIVEGTVYDKFDYRLMADFGTGDGSSSTAGNNAELDDAYVNARLWPDLQIQVGKFKSPVGLERLQSTAELMFVETGFATQMTPNYDLGAAIHNTLWNTPINYSIGIFNGAADNASDDGDVNDEGKDVVGRLFFQPFLHSDTVPLQKLGFGGGGSYGTHSGPLPSYKTPGQQTFFAYTNGVTANGPQYRIDPQAYYYWGPFGILGEYILSRQTVSSTVAGSSARNHFNNTAWQVEGSYFLTGEENSFKATSLKHVVPLRPFSLGGGGWGAFELVARVGQLSLDKAAFPLYATSTSASEATSWGAGLNWYLNSNLKLNLDFESTSFRGGSSANNSATANDEHAILTRVQFAF